MGTETNKYEDRNSPEYLAQLLKDKKQIQAFPSVFMHLERLLDEGKWQVSWWWAIWFTRSLKQESQDLCVYTARPDMAVCRLWLLISGIQLS